MEPLSVFIFVQDQPDLAFARKSLAGLVYCPLVTKCHYAPRLRPLIPAVDVVEDAGAAAHSSV